MCRKVAIVLQVQLVAALDIMGIMSTQLREVMVSMMVTYASVQVPALRDQELCCSRSVPRSVPQAVCASAAFEFGYLL